MFLTAREAAARLGIKLDTLYAYVSRGRLRSVAVPGTRQRRYRADEVEALREAATLPARAAETAGLTPVIASSICLIEEGRLHYRGQDAIALAATASLEEVAALLWQAPLADAIEAMPMPRPAPAASSCASWWLRWPVRLPHPTPPIDNLPPGGGSLTPPISCGAAWSCSPIMS